MTNQTDADWNTPAAAAAVPETKRVRCVSHDRPHVTQPGDEGPVVKALKHGQEVDAPVEEVAKLLKTRHVELV